MSEDKLTLKYIFLKFLNNFLNPIFENKFTRSSFVAGLALVGPPNLLNLTLNIALNFKFVDSDFIAKFSFFQEKIEFLNYLGAGMIVASFIFFAIILIKGKDEKRRFQNLKQAAPKIRKYIDDNRRIFINFGPNSSTASGGEVRRDMGMWEISKKTVICPNNAEIKSILTNIQKPTQQEIAVIDKMLNHIDAFDAHCKDPYFDYSDNQFPPDFSKLIHEYCGQISKSHINEYSNYLKTKITEHAISVESVIFFGSALYGEETADVDCLIKSNATSIDIVKNESVKWRLIRNSFKENFNIKLHLTIFSKMSKIDEVAYNDFLAKLPDHRKV